MCLPGASSTHSPATGRPCWGVLYALALSQLTALAVVELSGPPNALRLTLRWGLALGALATVAAWLRRNRAAIDLQDWCACAPQLITVRVIESRRPVSAPGPEPEERLPEFAEDGATPAAH